MQNNSAYMNVKEVADYLHIGVSTVWEWSRDKHDFPKQKRFSRRMTRWLTSDVLAYKEKMWAEGKAA